MSWKVQFLSDFHLERAVLETPMKFILLFALSTGLHAADCIAHRGDTFGGVVENSQQSIEQALELGADGVEFDIRHTLDGIPVLVHDKKLERVAMDLPGCDVQTPIRDQLFKDIQNCRLSDGQSISTLQEAMSLMSYSNALVFLELKDKPNELTGEIIRNSGIEMNRMRFISFKSRYLRKIKKYIPEIESLRLSIFIPFFSFTRGMNVAAHLKIFTAISHLFGNEVGVWTINSFKKLQKYHAKKVDFITTDRTDLCLEAKHERS